ncbi:MAG: leucine-rich repeat domain-containing protein [Clostridia bacterium]|nr:leucine-rich repeat domain-containing protein [Clostridia bacterium]
MRKWSKIILAILIVALALSAFVACKVRREELSLTFVSNEEQYVTTIGIDKAKEILDSQPSRDGFVFKGWYLDKGTWTQEVDSSNLEEISKGNKSISVYAYWVEIVNKITVAFCDYHGGILLEKEYERTDDQLAKDIAKLRPSKRPDDEKFTYTFDKWDCNTDDLTQGYFTANPIYSTQFRSFKFNYFVDGELIYTDSVKYGEDADKDLVAAPQKQSTEKYDYEFICWEGNFENITQDTDVHAKFQEKIKKFDVTFKFGNNKSKTVKTEYGSTATAPSANEIAKPSTAQYSYTFVGWDNSFDNIKQNTTVNAKYVEQVRMYDVKFWIDDTCIKYVNVPYGSSVEPPAQPIKNLDDGFTYEFTSWDVAFDNITNNLDVRARFRQVSHTYTVEYVNWEGSLLATLQVGSGEAAVYNAETPTRPSNDKFDYIFAGWTDEDKLEAVTRDITVQAKFISQIKTFSVTFKYGDNEKTSYPDIEYGTDLTKSNLVPSNVAKASTAQYEYEFIGWDATFDNITKDTVINARYTQSIRSYEVKFFVDDTCIKSVNVLYGSSVEAPTQPVKIEDDGFTYEFIEWDNDFDNIVEDTVVNAVFNKIANTYTIQYVNWDGTVLYTDSVESAGKSTYVGETPTREANDKYTYEFTGWTNEEALDNITSSFSTYAQFKEVIRTYTVTFNYGHGLTKEITGVPYGTDLSTNETYSSEIPTNTDKASTKQYDFTFIDWDKYFGYVSRDMEVNAIYKETLRRYIVKFINNGIAILTQEVEYGKCPTLPTGNNIRNHTVKWAFDFLGWQVLDVDTTIEGGENDIDPDDGTDYRDTVENFDGYEVLDPANTMVEGDITYTAMYSRIIQKYVVKFFNEENDENILKEITVPWGTNVLTSEIEDYQAPTAFKESVPKYDYTFTNWSRDLTKIEANINVYAIYSSTIRKYWIRYYNEGELVEEFHEEYDKVIPRTNIIPTKVSTLEYDFEFEDWDRAADRLVEGDVDINAVYKNNIRSYVVTLFNLATRALISTGEFAYGTKITTTIDYNGYDFDHWYRDPNCDTVFDQENETVDGPMMLFGNIVMKGLKFNDANEIVGYEGVQDAQINLVLPMAANGKKVTKVAERGLASDVVTPNSIGSIYVPSNIKVMAYAFAGLNLTDTGGIYIQAKKATASLTRPSGWAEYWNRDQFLPPWNEKNRPVTYGVDGVVSVGDFQYMIFEDGNAYVDRFINNTAPNAYIPADLTYKAASFTSTKWKDIGKTEVERDIYETVYEDRNYNVTQIAVSAFENCTNLSSIYIPKTIAKVGKYAFSGVTADVYIQMEQPKTLGVPNDNPSGWNNDWNKNRDATLTDKGTGVRTLYWGVIGFDVVGDFNYIFKSDGTAIVAEYLGNKATKTNLEVPGVVTYKEVEYRVEVLADELLSGMNILNTVTLGENIKKIGKKVFANNIVLSTVNLPSTLEEIGEQAFLMNMALKQIYIPASVSKIGGLAFIGIDNLTLYLGKDKKPLTGYAIGWDTKIGVSDLGDLDLSNIMGSIGTLLGKFTQTHDKVWGVAGLPQTYKDTTKSPALPAEYTYLFYTDGHAELIGSNIAVGSLNTSYAIPESINFNGTDYAVTKIKASAFKGNTRIKEIIIPTSVTTIEAYAFEGCSSLTIKTAHTSKPGGWDANFNPDGRTVEYSQASAATETLEEVA